MMLTLLVFLVILPLLPVAAFMIVLTAHILMRGMPHGSPP
jgi:hypothetical protein